MTRRRPRRRWLYRLAAAIAVGVVAGYFLYDLLGLWEGR